MVIWCEENSDEIDNHQRRRRRRSQQRMQNRQRLLPLRLCRPPLCKRRLKGEKPRIAAFWTWVMFLLAGDAGGVSIVMSVVDHNAVVTKTRLAT